MFCTIKMNSIASGGSSLLTNVGGFFSVFISISIIYSEIVSLTVSDLEYDMLRFCSLIGPMHVTMHT